MPARPLPSPARLTRRQLLVGGTALTGLAALSACTGTSAGPTSRPLAPDGPQALAAEAARTPVGARVIPFSLVAAPITLDLGGTTVDTWAYDGSLPGPELRATAGDILQVRVGNDLPQETTVHWHGLALRNDMDGVPGMTQQAVPVGASMTYRFALAHPGTYWFHPHVGVQLDRGLYAPLIIEDPQERGAYDEEHVVVLDDWLDGTGRTPDDVLADLLAQGMDTGSGSAPASAVLGGDAGDVRYPLYLINGRAPDSPHIVSSAPGRRIRFRFINAGGDTAFRVALGGHRMTVTHTDGFPVEPVEGAAILIGMGERVDAVATMQDGVFPLVALAEGKDSVARALIRTGSGQAPPAGMLPAELDGQLITVHQLRATDAVFLPLRRPDRSHDLVLGGGMGGMGVGMGGYSWTINGRSYGDRAPLQIREGDNVRLRLQNRTMMFHPLHVHGHTFQVRDSDGRGARKDTLIVLPRETLTVDLVADNPGQWLVHCHNIYHAEAGMMTQLSYVT